MYHRTLLSIAAAFLAAQTALAASLDLPSARPEAESLSSERLARLPAGMKTLVDEGRLSGVVTLVARHGKVVEFDAIGQRDIASHASMQKDSIFRIYSMSKPITGVAMMMLFEEGKWQLNDPVAKYIPEFANLKVFSTDAHGDMTRVEQTHPMTMRELMSHSAGFTYGFFSNTPVDKLQRDADVLNINNSLDEFIKRMAKLPLVAQPGTQFHYSVSVDIQGYIVQKLSGMPFDEYLAKRVFKPLGMVDTGFYVPADKLHRFAEMYTYGPDGTLLVVKKNESLNHDFAAKPALLSGGGGLVSTARDYLRFCQMLLNGGQLDGVRLLSPRTVELMASNMLAPNVEAAPGTGFGLDFAIYTDPVAAGGYYARGTYWWGGAAGTWFWIDPVNELIVIGMIQQLSGAGSEVPEMRGLSRAYTYQAMLDPATR